MAVTTEYSTQVTSMNAAPPVKLSARDHHGRIRIAAFEFTQSSAAGDATSTQDLVKLPAGKVRLLKRSSFFVCSAFGASRTLDIGFTAYTGSDGSSVSASGDTILDGADVSAAANLQCGVGTNGVGTNAFMDFDSRAGVTIQASVAGGTIPAGATLKGYFMYTQD